MLRYIIILFSAVKACIFKQRTFGSNEPVPAHNYIICPLNQGKVKFSSSSSI